MLIRFFEPVTGWRWWLHLGANETALMHPPRRPDTKKYTDAIEAITSALGQSLLAFDDITEVFASFGRALSGGAGRVG